MDTLFTNIAIFSLSFGFIKASGFNLPMRKRIHIHHGISGSSLCLTITTLIILFTFFENGHTRVNRGTTGIARTTFNFSSTVRVFTYKFTFGLRALRLLALPVTFRFFTDSFTFRFRYLAMGDAMGFFTNSNTFGTIIHFTCFIRAHNLTIRLFTFNITYSILRFLT
jgi:hypothetical protein